MTLLLARLLGAALAAAFTLTAAAPAATAPAEDSTSATPSAGWFLTLVATGHPGAQGGFVASSERLELVDPQGGEHPVATFPASRTRDEQLVSWSADGSTALLTEERGAGRLAVVVVDVATGGVHRIAVTDVSGAVVDRTGSTTYVAGVAGNDETNYPLWAYDADGHRTTLQARVSGPIIAGPDGTVLTGGAQSDQPVIRVLDGSTGAVEKTVPTPGHLCAPVRWWDDARLLVACGDTRPRDDFRVGLLDPTSGAFHLLTQRHPRTSPDLGDRDARRTTSGLFLQADGPCGVTFIAKAQPHGAVRPVKVRHAVGNVVMVGTRGSRLVVQHETSCDGGAPRSELALMNGRGHEQVLRELPADEQFGAVLGYGETTASTY